MSSIDIRVPDALRPFIDEQVARRGYRDANEYLVALVEADRLRDVQADLEAKLLEAVDSPSTEMSSKDWEEIRREGAELIRRRTSA